MPALAHDSAGEPIVWENHYECEGCGTSWADEWSCQCDDECPGCGTSISPAESIWIGSEDNDKEPEAVPATMPTIHPILGLSSAELAVLVWPMREVLKLEAAMVLWEAVDDICRTRWAKDQTGEPDDDNQRAALVKYRELVGSVQLRHDVMMLIEPLHIAWFLATRDAEIAGSFDWEFTPWFLQACVEIDPKHGLSLRSDWHELARAHDSMGEPVATTEG